MKWPDDFINNLERYLSNDIINPCEKEELARPNIFVKNVENLFCIGPANLNEENIARLNVEIVHIERECFMQILGVRLPRNASVAGNNLAILNQRNLTENVAQMRVGTRFIVRKYLEKIIHSGLAERKDGEDMIGNQLGKRFYNGMVVNVNIVVSLES